MFSNNFLASFQTRKTGFDLCFMQHIIKIVIIVCLFI